MNNNYVCIEGNIGAGKTTFTKRYAEITGATTILEQFSDNPFLASFYKNPKQFAFPLEMSFLAERFQQLNNIFSRPDLFTSSYVSDYTFLKTLVFAKNNLQDDEYALFKSFYFILNQKLPTPSFIIYLHTELDYIKTNINSRGREYEQNIDETYLAGLHTTYKSMLLSKKDVPIIILPYSKEDWQQIDESILQIQSDYIKQRLKKGLQLFSTDSL